MCISAVHFQVDPDPLDPLDPVDPVDPVDPIGPVDPGRIWPHMAVYGHIWRIWRLRPYIAVYGIYGRM